MPFSSAIQPIAPQHVSPTHVGSQHVGPTLVPSQPPHHSILSLWHLLSLDAPTIAALWTLFIAHCAGLALPWVEPAAMFVAVWMLYAADRLLDARPLPNNLPPPGLEARHLFHHHHRRAFLSLVAPTSIALVLLLHRIDPRALHLYTLLAALLGAWLLLIHARSLPTPGAHRLPKELAVGLFFPAAVFIPTVARAPQLHLALVPAFLLFAAVCTLNCLFLYAWEHPYQRAHAHWTTRWATSHLLPIAIAVLAIAIAATLLGQLHPSASHLHPVAASHLHIAILPAFACALSTALLLTLHQLRQRIPALTLRASADLALLTPLLLLPLLAK